MKKTIKQTIKLITLASLQTFVFTGINHIQPSQAASPNDFDLCIKQLTDTGLPANQAGQACAQAFRPKELSYCVEKINFHTQISPETLLNNCFQVRRPTELADCVVDIRLKADNNVDPNQVVNYCRRSLLPQRFANCVLSVNTQGKTPLSDSLDICIQAKNE